jgi:hypothetical protein
MNMKNEFFKKLLLKQLEDLLHHSGILLTELINECNHDNPWTCFHDKSRDNIKLRG